MMNKFLPQSRRLTTSIALALATLSVASAGHAAGLGRLNVQSALGQPLRAEVEVTSMTKEESQSLSAKLASPDAFKQAGLEYTSALNGLRFAVDRRPDGKAIVRISSNQPVNEPFVDLLVELNWASGKFVREYTFLLDPPELKMGQSGQQDNQVVAPALAAATAGSVSDAAQPIVPPRAAPAPAARNVTRTAQAPVAPAAAAPATSGQPVTVRAGETLASIANRFKPAEITLDQAIIAIYRANPSAFFGSVHQMRSGAELKIPDSAAMGAVDAQAARSEVRAQMANFNRYKARLAANARTVEAARAGQSASGQVSGSVTDQGASDTATDQLKLSKSAAAAGTGGRSVATRDAETRVAVDTATREAQSRVNELEKNVADLRRLLEMKDKQLADLQSAAKAATAAAPAARGAVNPAQPSAAPDAAAQQAAAAATAAAAAATAQRDAAAKEAAAAEAAAKDAAAKDVAAKEAAAREAVAAAQREAQANQSAQAAATTPAATATPAETPAAEPAAQAAAEPAAAQPQTAVAETPAEPVAEGGLLDDLTENPLVLPGIAAIIALIAGTAWVAIRRRRNVEKFEDSLIAPDGFAANSLFGSTGGQTGVDTHNSLFTASRETTSEVHSTEVDPIAEAEVYIAYGREAQAEEILKEALRKQPERQAIRLKLLEIYAGRKDARAFGDMAAEMYEATGGQNEEWPKVVTLGLSIDPDNALYTGKAEGGSSVAGAFTEVAETFTGDFAESQTPSGFRRDDEPRGGSGLGAAAGGAAVAGLSAAAAASLASRENTEIQAQETANFETTSAELTASPARHPAPDTRDDVPSLEFDLDLDTELKRAQAGDSDLARAVNGKYELPSLDLPATTSTASALETESGFSTSAVAELGEDLKIDLPAIEGQDERAVRSESAPAQPGSQAMDLSAIGLDLQPSTMVPPPNADVARWQEMATKLDLASAYEEIGDSEGARELLQEVLKGGDGEQQQRAQMMLSKLG